MTFSLNLLKFLILWHYLKEPSTATVANQIGNQKQMKNQDRSKMTNPYLVGMTR
jgi:hypothetical protein